jgi:hypothetical protein
MRNDRLRAALARFVKGGMSRGLPRSATPHPPTLTKAPVQISGSRGCRDVLDVAVGIDDDGRLIPAASIGQRQ